MEQASKLSTLWALEEKIRKAILKVARGYATLAMIEGQPGVGKSFTIAKVLEEEGITPVMVSGYVSSAYLYRLLFESNGQVIWLKDCTKLFEDMRALNILKNATETSGDRILSSNQYGVVIEDIPKQFIFTGRIILDYNTVKPKSKMDWEAIVSRSEHVVCIVSDEEMITRMRQLSGDKWQLEVTEYLISLVPETLPGQVNLRTQTRSYQTYRFAKQTGADWQKMVKDEVYGELDPIRRKLISVIGYRPMYTADVKKRLMLSGEVTTLRTADRRLSDWLEIGILERASAEIKNFQVRLTAR